MAIASQATADAIAKVYRERQKGAEVAVPGIAAMHKEYRLCLDEIKRLEDRKRQMTSIVRDAMGDAQWAVDDDGVRRFQRIEVRGGHVEYDREARIDLRWKKVD